LKPQTESGAIPAGLKRIDAAPGMPGVTAPAMMRHRHHDRGAQAMNWHEICAHPALKDLPFKLETDRWGHIVMSPASNRHSWLQAEIQTLLRQLASGGSAVVECSIETTAGIKVADVAWASRGFLGRHGDANPYPEAPEIVVEVLSESNTRAEMDEKKELYFARGAQEFWLCDADGGMTFHNNHAVLAQSVLVPDFPGRVTLPF
jgi:Uma2 family endonuclease